MDSIYLTGTLGLWSAFIPNLTKDVWTITVWDIYDVAFSIVLTNCIPTYLFKIVQKVLPTGLEIIQRQKCSIFTTSKTDRQLLRQKVRHRISVMKTNKDVFVVFKTKHELKCQFSGNTSSLLIFFDELFNVIFDDPFLML